MTYFFTFRGKKIHLDQRLQTGSEGAPFRLVSTKADENNKKNCIHSFKYVGDNEKLLSFVVNVQTNEVVNVIKEEYSTEVNDYVVVWKMK